MTDFVAKAERVARETGWRTAETCEENGWSAVGLGPVGHHRDSDAPAKSNFRLIYKDLQARFPESVEVAHFRHWAVGWVEEIIFDAGKREIVEAVETWLTKLDRNPIVDREDVDEIEWEENHPSDGECYSEERDCPCGTAERERAEEEAERAAKGPGLE